MRFRDLALVGLRLLAIWLACSALFVLTSLFYFAADMLFGGMSSPAGGSWAASGVLSQLIICSLHVVVAGLLFVYAPRLADWICRDVSDAQDARPVITLGAGDLYHVGCFLTGLWLLARAIRPGVRALVELVAQGSSNLFPDPPIVAQFAEAALLVIVGIVLVFGSRGLSRFLASLGHDPENIPAQQFSLRLLLGIVIGFALLLIVLRAVLRW